MNDKNKEPHIIVPDLNMIQDHSEKEVVQIFLQRFRDMSFLHEGTRLRHAIKKNSQINWAFTWFYNTNIN